MDPKPEYEARLNRWRAGEQLLERQFIRIGNWRLAVGIFEAVLAWLIFGRHLAQPWTLALPVVVFVVLVAFHARVERGRTLARRAIRFYERGLARLAGEWAEAGSQGDEYRVADHIYADDLDLFGRASLFQFLSTARTRAGEQVLADWLLAPAEPAEASARQKAVQELAGRLDLREDVALLGEEVRAEVQTDLLGRWSTAPHIHFPRMLRVVSPFLAIAGLVSLIGFFGDVLPLWPLAAVLIINAGIMVSLRHRVAKVFGNVELVGEGLRTLSLLLERLESESFETPLLQSIGRQLDVDGLPASKRIARLERWLDMLDSADHILVRAIRPLVLWNEQVVMAVEAWRQSVGPRVESWVSAVAQLEALSSLANLAFERPSWTFPILLTGREPLLVGRGLRHPLLPAHKSVGNDVSLSGERQLLIVSGSNMSGKSTLLRSIGVNTVLAWAGAPVAADSFEISPLQTAASIRVNDSLQDNRSRFYAEILRLRQIVDLTRATRPVLFLLDELLSGTNSHDRRIGATGIVSKLVRSGAVGLITTHDLALAEIAEELPSRAVNVHFEDRIMEGEVTFDFKLKPGLVTHSNALELMRAVGLEV
jgi:MutS domain V